MFLSIDGLTFCNFCWIGGGKPENAQASGTNVSGTTEALKKAVAYAMDKLGVTQEPTLVTAATEKL